MQVIASTMLGTLGRAGEGKRYVFSVTSVLVLLQFNVVTLIHFSRCAIQAEVHDIDELDSLDAKATCR